LGFEGDPRFSAPHCFFGRQLNQLGFPLWIAWLLLDFCLAAASRSELLSSCFITVL
jgi:hypothetical protein